jgi:hypothetical protein
MQAVRWMVAEEESCMRGVFFQAALLSLSLFLVGRRRSLRCLRCLLAAWEIGAPFSDMYVHMYVLGYLYTVLF